ncbi:MAG: ABC transporter substrate-binding protein [Chloroflexi bacterium]|nr:ABC transporter substrate-binding protein [Chloroflexota bacterium]MCC6892644.1 ABC transporter substrate-binding protein [Anaerolineae bacterium]
MNTQRSHHLKVSVILSLLVIALLSVFGVAAQEATAEPATGEPIYIGVSGPLTGNLAQYGEQWTKGFDLAIEDINNAGGIEGRPLEYIFEDSQSDPKQSVVVAQKFVDDERIVAELGDFSSTASMAASQIYTRGGLVQFGFTNSHPDFTKGSEYTWSTSVTQAQASPLLADFAVTTLGFQKLAVFQITNDWGKATLDLFAQRVVELGAEIVTVQPYLPDDKDFRSAITAVKDAAPDAIILLSYQADGALIAQQVREAGLTTPFVASASLQSPDYTELGGDAVEGTYVLGEFITTDPRPEVQAFVTKFNEAYDEDPDLFAALAYDSIFLIAEAIKVGGPTREGVLAALPQLKDVPSVVYGTVTFDPETRRALDPKYENLIVKDGAFVVWDGTAPAASGG